VNLHDGGEGEWQDPVIVWGAPRSGVHLLAALLDAHPGLVSGPELPFVSRMVSRWRGIDRTLGERRRAEEGVSRRQAGAACRTALRELLMPLLRRTGKRRFVYHCLGERVELDAFGELFPDARFIILLRDPRDVVRSLLQCRWRCSRAGHSSGEDDVGAAASLWADFVETALAVAPGLARSSCLTWLRYEELCTRPHEVMRCLGAFLGEVPPQPVVGSGAAALVTLSMERRYPPLRSGAIDAGQVGTWRTLRDEDIATIEAITATQRRRLGHY
jgi:hypothetical protein